MKLAYSWTFVAFVGALAGPVTAAMAAPDRPSAEGRRLTPDFGAAQMTFQFPNASPKTTGKARGIFKPEAADCVPLLRGYVGVRNKSTGDFDWYGAEIKTSRDERGFHFGIHWRADQLQAPSSFDAVVRVGASCSGKFYETYKSRSD